MVHNPWRETVRFKVVPGGKAPVRNGAAWDCYARLSQPVYIEERRIGVIPLGIALWLPPEYGAIIKGRSMNPTKRGYDTVLGLVDPEYNGREIHAIIIPFHGLGIVQPEERIAQLWIQWFGIGLEETTEDIPLGEKKGFGSSGR